MVSSSPSSVRYIHGLDPSESIASSVASHPEHFQASLSLNSYG